MRPNYELLRPVFFVGFMGAGKTSVARRLARSCGVASLDVDTYIERHEGKPITQIFEEVGEGGFRKIESSVLTDIAQNMPPMLISCGGGVLTHSGNAEIMKGSGVVIHLQVSADEAAARIVDTSTRPLFTELDAARARLEARMPAYMQAADFTVDTRGFNVSEISREVKTYLIRTGVLASNAPKRTK
jgi:shikimate kinase